MNKVITVNLNGNAFMIDEDGYLRLREYLDRAERQMKDTTDRREVLFDLEQAIGEKCGGYLRPHKNVITDAEIAEILSGIGPVQATDETTRSENRTESRFESSTAKTDGPNTSTNDRSQNSYQRPRQKRLYRIRRGSGWAGVCRGIAAYLDVDVILVRVLFVLGTLCSGGFGLLVYILMIFLVPIAYTDSDFDAAHAVPPEYRHG